MPYFARFADYEIYAAGPQKNAAGETVPGGPIAYCLYSDAATIARAIGGDVIEKDEADAIALCKKSGVTLWVKQAFGEMGYIKETVPQNAPDLIRVEGDEREAAIEASQRLS